MVGSGRCRLGRPSEFAFISRRFCVFWGVLCGFSIVGLVCIFWHFSPAFFRGGIYVFLHSTVAFMGDI